MCVFAHQASSIWMDKIASDVPFVETLINKMATMETPSLPENLFMNL